MISNSNIPHEIRSALWTSKENNAAKQTLDVVAEPLAWIWHWLLIDQFRSGQAHGNKMRACIAGAAILLSMISTTPAYAQQQVPWAQSVANSVILPSLN